MSKRLIEALSVGLSLLFAFLVGMIAGRLPARGASTSIVPDPRPRIPVVRIDGIKGNEISGSIHGEARLILADSPVATNSGAFRAPAKLLMQTTAMPAGGKFVASKRGKKYYTIGSPSAEKLSPSNRVYFQSAAEAEAAGYIR